MAWRLTSWLLVGRSTSCGFWVSLDCWSMYESWRGGEGRGGEEEGRRGEEEGRGGEEEGRRGEERRRGGEERGKVLVVRVSQASPLTTPPTHHKDFLDVTLLDSNGLVLPGTEGPYCVHLTGGEWDKGHGQLMQG